MSIVSGRCYNRSVGIVSASGEHSLSGLRRKEAEVDERLLKRAILAIGPVTFDTRTYYSVSFIKEKVKMAVKYRWRVFLTTNKNRSTK